MATLTDQDRLELTQIIMGILNQWRVPLAEQAVLLGMPTDTKPRAMKRYHEGLAALPDQGDTWQRVRQIAGIAESLRTTYPLNPAMAAVWLNRRNHRFGDRSPLQSMLEDGLPGMVAVHMHLDCSYDWFMDDRQYGTQEGRPPA